MSAYRTTEEADEDLIAIFLQGHDLFGLNQANRYLDDLGALFQRLARWPASALARPDLGPGVRACPHKAHVVIYEEASEGILVLRVRHAHEDWQADPGLPECETRP